MWTIILSFGIFQGLLLAAALLFSANGKRLANRYLSGLLVLLSLNIFLYLAIEQHAIRLPFAGFVALQSLPFLFGPLLYGYVLHAMTSGIGRHRLARHFAPAIVVALLAIPIWLISAIDGSSQSDFGYPAQLLWLFYLLRGLQMLQMLYYNILAIRLIRLSGSTGSQESKATGSWLTSLIRGYSIFLGLVLLYFLLLISGVYYSFSKELDIAFALIISLFVHYIALKTWLSPDLIATVEQADPPAKYRNSYLTEELRRDYQARLEAYMSSERPHIAADLKLRDLAAKLSIQPHYLSQLINEQYGMNFFEFINAHRVAEAKRKMLEAAADYTLLAIAFEVGFNSKTAFNRAFKKHTRMTPSQYRSTLR